MQHVLRLISRPALLVAAVGLLAYSPCRAQDSAVRVLTVVDSLRGAVGGVTVDRAGNIFVADFGDNVWRVKPDGRHDLFATGFYGASGNTVDRLGNLFQASFYGNYVSKVDRSGVSEVYVSEGLQGPVGLVFDAGGNLYVNNCSGNSVSRVSRNRAVETFAESSLFNCPNGIAIGADSNLYVVNFSDDKLLKITPDGSVSELAVLPGGGNGHVAVAGNSLFATSFRGQRLYRISFSGDVELIAGTGAIGEIDGSGSEAAFSWPNGIAAGPGGDRLYINDYVNRFPPTTVSPPAPISSLRMVKLPSLVDLLAASLRSGGMDAMIRTYREYKSQPSTAGTYTEIDVNAFGYGLMQTDQMAAALEVFKLNAESYPNSFNVYDSLAEAQLHRGQRERAIENYRKSLELNPANTNAAEMLQKLENE